MIEKVAIIYGTLFDVALFLFGLSGFIAADAKVTKIMFGFSLIALVSLFYIRKEMFLSFIGEEESKISEEEPFVTYVVYVLSSLSMISYLILG